MIHRVRLRAIPPVSKLPTDIIMASLFLKEYRKEITKSFRPLDSIKQVYDCIWILDLIWDRSAPQITEINETCEHLEKNPGFWSSYSG